MSDHLREAGIIVAHLNRALLDGSRDLKTVPSLIKRIIADGMWRERVDPASGRKVGPFKSFAEFVGTPAGKGGLGSSLAQLRGLCAQDIEARDVLDAQLQKEGHPGERTDLGNNVPEVKRPEGNTEAKALRRLRKDRPDLHAQVIAGRVSANWAMVEARFRPRTISVPVTRPEAVARSLLKHMSADDLALLIVYLIGAEPK